MRVLEVGCGAGANLWFMAREGFAVHGVERSATAVRLAQERLDRECPGWRERGGRIDVGDMAHVDAPDASFDAVLDVVATCYASFDEASRIFAELARVTRPGGRLFSRTFAEGCWGEGTGAAAGPRMWHCAEGPLAGLGATRFTAENEVPRLLGSRWRIDHIERATQTEDDRRHEHPLPANPRHPGGCMTRTIATICARGGSKGLPRKNVLPFAGKPLIAHTIAQALACPGIDGVFVSTDDDEIADIARAHGAQVPYRRPAALATDEAAKIPAIEHLVQHLERAGAQVDVVVDLQPTSPLRLATDITAALALAGNAPLVVSVTEPSHNPYYSLVEVQADGTLALSKSAGAARRQDVPGVWGLNGSIYVWQRAALRRAAEHGFWTVSMHPYRMPRERSIDIDDALDFAMAEWMLRQREGAR